MADSDEGEDVEYFELLGGFELGSRCCEAE